MIAQTQEIFQKANDCFNRGEFKKAQVMYNDIIESVNPRENKKMLSEAYFNLANIFHMQGEIGKAIKAFNKVLELEPNHTDASISLSVLYNDIGHYESAKKVFDQADKRVKQNAGNNLLEDKHINNKFAGKHYELAEMYMSYNRYDEALFEYNKVIALDPENLEARVKIAKVYAKKKFVNKAFDELKKLKNEYPKYNPGRVALGVLYYGSGKVLEAQNEWQKVLATDPRNEEARMYINLSETATETRI